MLWLTVSPFVDEREVGCVGGRVDVDPERSHIHSVLRALVVIRSRAVVRAVFDLTSRKPHHRIGRGCVTGRGRGHELSRRPVRRVLHEL